METINVEVLADLELQHFIQLFFFDCQQSITTTIDAKCYANDILQLWYNI